MKDNDPPLIDVFAVGPDGTRAALAIAGMRLTVGRDVWVDFQIGGSEECPVYLWINPGGRTWEGDSCPLQLTGFLLQQLIPMDMNRVRIEWHAHGAAVERLEGRTSLSVIGAKEEKLEVSQHQFIFTPLKDHEIVLTFDSKYDLVPGMSIEVRKLVETINKGMLQSLRMRLEPCYENSVSIVFEKCMTAEIQVPVKDIRP